MTNSGKDNFFQYLLHHQEDDWGITCIGAGYFHAPPKEKYPPSGHPESHAFEWETGRILHDYYIIYIPTGSGYFDTASSNHQLQAGDAMFIYGGDWHRYKPQFEKGWEEYWIGFNGNYIENYIIEDLFPQKRSYLKKIGYQSELIMLFNQLIELTKKNTPFFKKVLLGCLLQIIAYFTIPTQEKNQTNRGSQIVENTMDYIRQNLAIDINFQSLAQNNNLSYSRFRSIFKNETGTSLNQFLINERVECAKRLLINTSMDIKEISYKSGFQSPYYFSKIFKQKTGYTPSSCRR